MSLLSSVTKGKAVGAQINVVAGDNGVGKSTFAASFPGSLLLDLEKGSLHIECERIPAEKLLDLASLRGVIKELIETTHSYKNIVIDSVEVLEAHISDAVCLEGKVKSLEDYGGGFGKGYVRSREIMREIFSDLRLLQAKGVSTILVAHTQKKPHTDPATNQTYDRVIMRANDKLASVIRDLADNVLYCTHKVFTTEKNNKTQAFGNGQRVMFTQYRPGFDAKNRLDLPFELPLSYEAFAEASSKKANTKCEEIIAEIEAMSKSFDDALKTKVKDQIATHKNNPEKLREIENRLMKYANA